MESVAYIVCDALGLDGGEYSFPYVTHWAQGKVGIVKETAEKAVGCAKEILSATDSDYQDIASEPVSPGDLRDSRSQTRVIHVGRRLLVVMTAALVISVDCSEGGRPDLAPHAGSDSPVEQSSDSQIGLALTDGPNGPGLYVMNVDGSGLRRVVANCCLGATWSPDGTRIAYMEGSPPQIWMMGATGDKRRQLTDYGDGAEAPAWSADGTMLVFARGASTLSANGDVYVMDADGSHPRQVTSGDRSDISPSLAPDGSKVAFEGGTPGRTDIYVADVGTGVETRIAHGGSFPVWSPDGGLILFKKPSGGLWTMRPDGTGEQEIPLPFTQPAFHSWSADGSQIAFIVEVPPDYSQVDVFVVSSDGQDPQRVLSVPGPVASLSWVPSNRE